MPFATPASVLSRWLSSVAHWAAPRFPGDRSLPRSGRDNVHGVSLVGNIVIVVLWSRVGRYSLQCRSTYEASALSFLRTGRCTRNRSWQLAGIGVAWSVRQIESFAGSSGASFRLVYDYKVVHEARDALALIVTIGPNFVWSPSISGLPRYRAGV